MPTAPDPSPPFHQISLPPPWSPVRKLQAVRFSIDTPSALNASTPLRPDRACRRRPAARGPGRLAWFEQLGAPGLVPSTITWLRSMPRRCRSALLSSTPAPPLSSPAGGVVHLLVVVAGTDEDPVARLGRGDRLGDGGVLARDAVPGSHAQHVGRCACHRGRRHHQQRGDQRGRSRPVRSQPCGRGPRDECGCGSWRPWFPPRVVADTLGRRP